MNIDKTAIGGGRHDQESFGMVPTFERSPTNRGHKNWLAILTLDKVWLLCISFLFPLKPAVGEADRPSVLPQRLEHPAGGCSLNPGINQRRFIPPSRRIAPVNGIEMELLIAFIEE